jgi:hypothetical protein
MELRRHKMSSMVLLQRVVLNSTGLVTFNNIPQTGYTDLVIQGSYRGAYAGQADGYMTFNGDSSALYNSSRMNGIGSGVSSSTLNSQTQATAFGVHGSTATANAFSAFTLFINNYSDTTRFKAFTTHPTILANNSASDVQLSIFGGIYSSTNAISSVTLNVASGFVAGSTFSLYGVTRSSIVNTSISPRAYGGNIIKSDGTYWYHIFTSSGTFTPKAANLPCEILVVGGGAQGGYGGGGGGGAGAIHNFVSQTLSNTGYSVTVGAGGSGAVIYGPGGNGGASYFYGTSTLQADGGGGGGAQNAGSNTGGCGGGATGGTNHYAQGTYLAFGSAPTGNGIGNYGGNSFYGRGGGGGGYSQQGGFSTSHHMGVAMALTGDYSLIPYTGQAGRGAEGLTLPSGLATILGQTVISSGGGAGTTQADATAPGQGGTGGGSGSYDHTVSPTSATTYGSGGGGSGITTGIWQATVPGLGFQGLVVVRYLL